MPRAMTPRLPFPVTHCLAALLALPACAAPPVGQSPRQANVAVPGVKLRTYETPYYYIHTDLPEADAREAMIRTTRMFEAYHSRTAELFRGQINQKLPFYLFSRREDYYAAGGMPNTAGVFNGTRLMATAVRSRSGSIGLGTWHTVQHEGFHQFVAYVIQGEIPIWVNEGLAEYFGEAVFTGDGMVTGLIPNGRLQRIRQEIRDGKFKSIKDMMLLTHQAWNADISMANYDQAWSMVQFLAVGENGKYREAFAKFLQLVSRGRPWADSWLAAFGSAEGFEQRWKDYWLNLPDDPTLDLYAQADVAALTSFMGRAYTQKQTFDDVNELLNSDAKSLKANPVDWLPPDLFDEMKDLTQRLQERPNVAFRIERPQPKSLPRLLCTLQDGTQITGTFETAGGGNRIGRVSTMTKPPAPEKKEAATQRK
jgi:hypothetical protein